jgi:hypothetical protein
MITSFVDMEAKPIPQQQNPNIPAIVRLILLFLNTLFTKEKKSKVKSEMKDSPTMNPLFLIYFMYITLLNMRIPSSDKIRDTIAQNSIEEWETILLKFLNNTPREQDLPWTEEEKEVWVLILYFISYQERTRKHRYLQIKTKDRCDIYDSQLFSLGLRPFKETRPINVVISFLNTLFTKEKKSETETALSDKKSPETNPVFLLYFMYIALLDKNLARSKKVPTFNKLKSIMLYGETKIEVWETILLTFLNETPRVQGFPWTEEEKDVWKLVLFFVSEQFGGSEQFGVSEQFGSSCIEKYYFRFNDEKRRAQLSPLIHQLGLKSFKESATSIPVNPCAKKYQTVMCKICEFHGDPENSSKTCGCCYECNSRDAVCKRCRICGQHDSTKCSCCPICKTSAEYCRKCPECNEHECSC